jgi:hypothetical protein
VHHGQVWMKEISLSHIRADRGAQFWLWFVVKVVLGIAQMGGALFVLCLYVESGLSETTMKPFLVVAAITTVSMILFRVLGWKPVKR